MRNRFGLWIVVAFTALVVNPNLACSSDEETDEQFEYGESEMQAAVLGSWSGNLILGDREETFTLVLEQASANKTTQGAAQPGYRAQCGSRSFVKPAAACISSSDMPLVGKITSSGGTFTDTVVSGHFIAYVTLTHAELSLEFGPNYVANAEYSDGKFNVGTVRDSAQVPQGSFLIQR